MNVSYIINHINRKYVMTTYAINYAEYITFRYLCPMSTSFQITVFGTKFFIAVYGFYRKTFNTTKLGLPRYRRENVKSKHIKKTYKFP